MSTVPYMIKIVLKPQTQKFVQFRVFMSWILTVRSKHDKVIKVKPLFLPNLFSCSLKACMLPRWICRPPNFRSVPVGTSQVCFTAKLTYNVLLRSSLLRIRIRRITLMRIRIRLFILMRTRIRPFTLMRSWIRPFTLMRIRIRPFIMPTWIRPFTFVRIRILLPIRSDANQRPLAYRPSTTWIWAYTSPLLASTALHGLILSLHSSCILPGPGSGIRFRLLTLKRIGSGFLLRCLSKSTPEQISPLVEESQSIF